MNRYVKAAIRKVAHTDNPEVFAENNQTAYQIANEVYGQMLKDAIDGMLVDDEGERMLVVPSLPTITRSMDDGDKVKVLILK